MCLTAPPRKHRGISDWKKQSQLNLSQSKFSDTRRAETNHKGRPEKIAQACFSSKTRVQKEVYQANVNVCFSKLSFVTLLGRLTFHTSSTLDHFISFYRSKTELIVKVIRINTHEDAFDCKTQTLNAKNSIQ